MANIAVDIASDFKRHLEEAKPNLVLIRADRFEMLPLAMLASYKGIPVVHIEGGDLTGVIDNKVRYAISHLSDYHFCTHEEAKERLTASGIIKPYTVWNFGSLDVEYASMIPKYRVVENPYILVTYHAIGGEDEKQLDYALEHFKEFEVIKIKGNKDYNKEYGEREYTPEEYVNLMRHAECVVGNSSSLFKEMSTMEVCGVNVGDRQKGRLHPNNLIDAKPEKSDIISAMEWQIGNRCPVDSPYYQKNTAQNIANQIWRILNI